MAHDDHKKIPPATEATLRDYFAEGVMQKFAVLGDDPVPAAKGAYIFADAMLEARKTPEEIAAEKKAAEQKAAQDVLAAAKTPAAKV